MDSAGTSAVSDVASYNSWGSHGLEGTECLEVEPYPLADRLRVLMAERQIGHRILSELADVGGDGVRNILRGRSRRPRLDTLSKIARALQVSIDELTGAKPKPAAPPRSSGPFRRSMMDPAVRPEWGASKSVVPDAAEDEASRDYGLDTEVPLTDVSLVCLGVVADGQGCTRPFDLLDPARRITTTVLPVMIACPPGCVPAVENGDAVLCQAPSGAGESLRMGDLILVDGKHLAPCPGVFLVLHHGLPMLASVAPGTDESGWMATLAGQTSPVEVTQGMLRGRVLGRLGLHM